MKQQASKRQWLRVTLSAVAGAALLSVGMGAQAEQNIVVASTTSTQASGLYEHLLPQFKKATGIEVKVVALGTGQAIDTARRGDADVLFVHDTVKEEQFVADGFADKRFDVMYNDFVLIGPKADPAGAKGADIVAGLEKVAAANAAFVSRGDKSGTHAAELRFWKQTSTDANKGTGYKECGCGMGQALNIAASSGGYVMSDRATWLNFKNKADLEIVVEGDKRMFNQYGVMLVSPAKFPHIKTAEGQKFIDWVTGKEGQAAIADYKIDGQQLFFPNATK
ncbi:substrate-binding domain-containing protein [Hydrogenophaga sp. 5NK40-0174]|uniref:substrate-binding domain-containing protein n=1 Tax=Hydrogenophaga sp. 5NK40-0174 TaxID=3127649 RepID=UPI0031032E28